MAFEQNISDTKVDVADAISSKVGTASRLQALEGIVEAAGGIAGSIFQQKHQTERQGLVKETLFDLQDLEVERSAALQTEQQVQAELQRVAGTPQEQETVDRLKKRIDFLNQARSSGILSEQGFSTRMNALYRERLSAAENLGIVGEVHQLFQAQRTSAFAAPKPSAGEQQIISHMDSMFPGGWTQQQMAEEVGKIQKARGILNSPNMTPVDAGLLMDLESDTIIKKYTASTSDSGELFTDLEIMAYGDEIKGKARQAKQHVYDNVSKLRNLGQYDQRAQERTEAIIKAIDDKTEFWSKGIFDTPAYKDRGLLEATQRANKLIEELTMAALPADVKTVMFAMGGGEGGKRVAGQVFADMLEWDMRVWSNMALTDPQQRTPERYKSDILAAVSDAKQVGQNIHQSSIIPPGVKMTIASLSAKRNAPEEPKEYKEYVQTQLINYRPVANDPVLNRDSAVDMAKNLDKLSAEAKQSGNFETLRTEINENIVLRAKEIMKYAEDQNLPVPIMRPDGKFDASALKFLIDSTKNLRGESATHSRAKKLMGMLEGTTLLHEKAVSNGYLPAKDLMPFYQKEEAKAVADVRATIVEDTERFQQSLPTEVSPGIVDTIVQVESGGKADAKAATSSALGAGQFVASTWMDLVKRNRPDLMEGRTEKEVLELRRDPELSREMVANYAQFNQVVLANAGFEASDRNTYLAHFAGPSGALGLLMADPKDPVSEVLSKRAIDANPFLKGWTVQQVLDWADKKVR